MFDTTDQILRHFGQVRTAGRCSRNFVSASGAGKGSRESRR